MRAETVSRLREYLDAMTKVILHVEEMEECDTFDELDYLEGTLIELLERHRDVCRPKLRFPIGEEAESPDGVTEVDVAMDRPRVRRATTGGEEDES